ncbi:GlcG/HbpS family heme-binding protein, partial [Kaarinaea lacus]
MKSRRCLLITGFITLLSFTSPTIFAEDQPAMVDIKRMSLDMALTAAKATIDACRKEGVQIAVTIIDRGGHPQAVLRDVLAMDLTLPISHQKAYTAMSFNTATSGLEGRFSGNFSVPKIDGVLIS